MSIVCDYLTIGTWTYLAAQTIEMFQNKYYRIDRDNALIIPLTIALWPILWFITAVVLLVRALRCLR